MGDRGFLRVHRAGHRPVNIQTTLVEPGGARTEFAFRSATLGAQPIEADANTPVGNGHRMIESGTRVPLGDPVKMVRAMIVSSTRK